jgi:glutathione S-transferase
VELYHNDMSTCAQKVRLVIFEKRLEVTLKHLNLRAGDQNAPDYLRLNPKGVVPTLVDAGQPIIESSIICEYLEDVSPDISLRPADSLQRARMRQWTMLPDAGLHPAVGTTCMAVAFRHQFNARGPESVAQYLAGRPDPVARERMRGLLERGLDAPGVDEALRFYRGFVARMARQLATTPWLVGEQFTLADAMALPYIVRLEHLGFQEWWTGDEATRGGFESWLARCKQRDSWRAIADFIDPAYVELLGRTGAEALPRVRTAL